MSNIGTATCPGGSCVITVLFFWLQAAEPVAAAAGDGEAQQSDVTTTDHVEEAPHEDEQ